MLISPSSEWKDNAEERKFLTKYGAPTLPFYNDENNRLSLSLGIGSTPYTVIMNRNGKKSRQPFRVKRTGIRKNFIK